jgi:hypothetical protein
MLLQIILPEFIGLLVTCVALFAVVQWPRVRGKAWLVGSLATLVLVSLYFKILALGEVYLKDEDGDSFYDRFHTLSILIMYIRAAAFALLVVAFFRLRPVINRAQSLLDAQLQPHADSLANDDPQAKKRRTGFSGFVGFSLVGWAVPFFILRYGLMESVANEFFRDVVWLVMLVCLFSGFLASLGGMCERGVANRVCGAQGVLIAPILFFAMQRSLWVS